MKVEDTCLNTFLSRFRFQNQKDTFELTLNKVPKILIDQPEPIICPVLKATKEVRNALIQEHSATFDFSKVRLDQLAEDMQVDNLKRGASDM